jgi:RNA polymerase sigma-70 factor (ECF subfamily)
VKATLQNRRLRLVDADGAAELRTHEKGEVSDAGSVAPPAIREDAPRSSRTVSGRGGALEALPDAQLVVLGMQGNTAALELLYRRYASFALHLAVRIAGSSRDAEDVVHDAFLKAFDKLPELADGALFKAWLGSIVVHAVRSKMRRGRLMKTLGIGHADPVEIDAIASASASPLVRAQIAQIYALLQTLPTDERIAWTLRAVEGHELETVAQLTRCSLATVKRRIGRAQGWLDEHFVEARQQEDAR